MLTKLAPGLTNGEALIPQNACRYIDPLPVFALSRGQQDGRARRNDQGVLEVGG